MSTKLHHVNRALASFHIQEENSPSLCINIWNRVNSRCTGSQPVPNPGQTLSYLRFRFSLICPCTNKGKVYNTKGKRKSLQAEGEIINIRFWDPFFTIGKLKCKKPQPLSPVPFTHQMIALMANNLGVASKGLPTSKENFCSLKMIQGVKFLRACRTKNGPSCQLITIPLRCNNFSYAAKFMKS